MKIKVVDMPYQQVMALPRPQRPRPLRPSPLIRGLLYAVSAPELRQVGGTHYVACHAYDDPSFRLRRNANG